MTPVRVCAAVAFVLLVILIIVTRDIATIRAPTNTTTTKSTSPPTTTTTTATAVYFVAKRDSIESIETNNKSEYVTFTDIQVNVGGGMNHDGWFIAPVAGWYG